jgi:hypothetical protein
MSYVSPLLQIHSLALSFPKGFIRDIRAAHELNCRYPAYRLLYYGDTGILVIAGAVINPAVPILAQAVRAFTELIQNGILYPGIQLANVRLHELELRYTFWQCQPFICKSAGFRKVGNRYLSRDYRQVYRSNGELKETRKSFVCVELHRGGAASSLILNIAGRRRQHLSLFHLSLTTPRLFSELAPLLSCFLSQAASPIDFGISPHCLPYLDPQFIALFANAGWFQAGPFVRKRARGFSDGGPLCLDAASVRQPSR